VVLVAVVASIAEGSSSLLAAFGDTALSSPEHSSSRGRAGIVVEVGSHEVVAAVAEGMLNTMEAEYLHTQDYCSLLANMVAPAVVDTVAASVAGMDTGLAGGCRAVHVQPGCRDSILEPPSLVASVRLFARKLVTVEM
jgi:hypothetical protein